VSELHSAWEELHRAFDRIFVVSLARATDRQARIRERLAGLRYELHLGVDKRDLDPARLLAEGYDEAAARRASRLSRPMSPGEIGCALSHRQLYRAAVQQGWGRVLVFEDDVAPRREELAALPAVLGQLPPSWELLYLGWTNFERVTLRHRAKQAAYLAMSAARLMKWTPREVLRLHPAAHSPNLRRAGLHHCTHAYAFTQAGARKLLAAQTPLAHVADQLLIHLVLRGELEAYVAEPNLFDQEAGAGRSAEFSYVHHG
jgi:glycosyl transferase family 25